MKDYNTVCVFCGRGLTLRCRGEDHALIDYSNSRKPAIVSSGPVTAQVLTKAGREAMQRVLERQKVKLEVEVTPIERDYALSWTIDLD